MGIPGRRTSRSTTSNDESFFGDWTRRNADSVPYTGPDDKPHRRRRRGLAAGVLVAAAVTSVVLPSTSANADPSRHTWHRLRNCESGNNYSINTGNAHYGAYQFDLSTWRSVGGSGYPYLASKQEQDARALILYRERGWSPWQCAGILGLKEDSDAGSGRISDISVSGGGVKSGGGSSKGGNHAFPGGSHQYFYGENNVAIKTFQNQMHRRGFFPAGTGQYGPLTLRMVKRLQGLNGLAPLGYIGPKTWQLAWTGKYSTPTRRTHAPAPKPTPAPARTRVPAFPGRAHLYVYGETSRTIRTFQNQMHRRGFFPVGTGQYGPRTLRMVKRLQRLNGLAPTGHIGPHTWRLAWRGKYS